MIVARWLPTVRGPIFIRRAPSLFVDRWLTRRSASRSRCVRESQLAFVFETPASGTFSLRSQRSVLQPQSLSQTRSMIAHRRECSKPNTARELTCESVQTLRPSLKPTGAGCFAHVVEHCCGDLAAEMAFQVVARHLAMVRSNDWADHAERPQGPFSARGSDNAARTAVIGRAVSPQDYRKSHRAVAGHRTTPRRPQISGLRVWRRGSRICCPPAVALRCCSGVPRSGR